jgi:hypothetical protein
MDLSAMEMLRQLIDRGLWCNPYHEREFVALKTTSDFPTSDGREIKTRHDELIVFCPTPITPSGN